MKKFIIVSLIIIPLMIILGLSMSKNAYAVEIGAGNFKTTINDPDVPYTSVDSAIGSIVNAVITIAEVAFILLFLVGGIMYLTSTGNEEQAGKARKLIIDAVIGLIIVLSAWAVSTWILGKLKGDDTEANSGSNSELTDPGVPVLTDSIPTNDSTTLPETVDTSSDSQACLDVCYKNYQKDYAACGRVQSCEDKAESDYFVCEAACRK